MKTFPNNKWFRSRTLVRSVVVVSLVLIGLAQALSASPAAPAPPDSFALEPWWQVSDDLSDVIPAVLDTDNSAVEIGQRERQLRDHNPDVDGTRRVSSPCKSTPDRTPRQIESRNKNRVQAAEAEPQALRGSADQLMASFGTPQQCARFAALCQLLVDA
jgi:hypothetical protein